MLALAAFATGAAAFALRLVWPVGTETFGLQLGYFASYIVLFAAGCFGAPAHWLNEVPDRQRYVWRLVTWLALPVLPIAFLLMPYTPALQGNNAGGWNLPAALYAFWEPLVAWGLILTLVPAFERGLASPGRIWTALSRRSYAIYIIHPPVLVAVALAWRDVAAPHLAKFVVTGTVGCLVCFWIAGLLLRVPPVRRVL
jgi:peptidoglycan/LPS O-acetylase OafA/YrhL